MTILTADGREKPKEAQVLINPETLVKVEFKQAQRDAATKQRDRVHADIETLIQRRRRRRRYLAMNIAVAIASLLVVVAGICGGMYVYKWITHSSRLAMQGSCTVPYHEDPQVQAYAQRRIGGRNEERRVFEPPMFRPRDGAGRAAWQPYFSGRFVEKYNVLNPDQEVLQVPQPGVGGFSMMPLNIIHDFSAKLTTIVDGWNSRCFVKPLDQNVVPPLDLIDLIRRIEDGTYVPNICLIRKHYRAQQPPLDSAGLAALRSDILLRSCASLTTYQLVRIDTATTALPEALSTTPSMLLGGDNDYDRQRAVDEDSDEEVETNDQKEVTYVTGPGVESDDSQELERARRSVDQVESVAKEASADDDDDMVFNLGYGGDDSVELALIHFD